MPAVANVRVNVSAPFPAWVQGAGGIVVAKVNGVWTIQPAGGSLVSLTTQNTWTALQTFNAGISVNGLQGTQNTGNGLTTVSAPFSYNTLTITDNINAGSNTVDGLSVFLGMAGSAVSGARQAFQSTIQLTQPTSGTNPSRNYVAGQFTALASAGDGGGTGTEKGFLFGLNPVVTTTAAATHLQECSGGEVDTLLAAGSSTLNKYGWKIVQEATDAVAGSTNDAALFMANQAGAVGWGTLWQIGDGVNASPVKTAGSIVAIKGTPTIANGIDLSGATFTGSVFKGPNGFSVTGAGGVVTAGLQSTGFIASPAPTTVTAATVTLGFGTPSVIFNNATGVTATLPAASSFPGAWFYFRNIAAGAVVSASSNVVPVAGGAAGTAILAATAGKWALLQSDGTNYQVMAAN